MSTVESVHEASFADIETAFFGQIIDACTVFGHTHRVFERHLVRRRFELRALLFAETGHRLLQDRNFPCQHFVLRC